MTPDTVAAVFNDIGIPATVDGNRLEVAGAPYGFVVEPDGERLRLSGGGGTVAVADFDGGWNPTPPDGVPVGSYVAAWIVEALASIVPPWFQFASLESVLNSVPDPVVYMDNDHPVAICPTCGGHVPLTYTPGVSQYVKHYRADHAANV